MRRMFSEKQIQGLAQEQAKAVKKDIVTLVDANGNDRFIEGDITMEEITGLTQTYGKWSLSGTHFMIVVGFDLDTTATLSNSQTIADNIVLPDFILDKIVPLFANEVVDYQTTNLRTDSWGSTQFNYTLRKGTGKLYIASGSNITEGSYVRHGRIAFDLLIDNE